MAFPQRTRANKSKRKRGRGPSSARDAVDSELEAASEPSGPGRGGSSSASVTKVGVQSIVGSLAASQAALLSQYQDQPMGNFGNAIQRLDAKIDNRCGALEADMHSLQQQHATEDSQRKLWTAVQDLQCKLNVLDATPAFKPPEVANDLAFNRQVDITILRIQAHEIGAKTEVAKSLESWLHAANISAADATLEGDTTAKHFVLQFAGQAGLTGIERDQARAPAKTKCGAPFDVVRWQVRIPRYSLALTKINFKFERRSPARSFQKSSLPSIPVTCSSTTNTWVKSRLTGSPWSRLNLFLVMPPPSSGGTTGQLQSWDLTETMSRRPLPMPMAGANRPTSSGAFGRVMTPWRTKQKPNASAITWNMRLLLHQNLEMRQQKVSTLQAFVRSHDVVAIQEVHGTLPLLQTLLCNIFRKCHVFHSFHEQADADGVVTIISTSLGACHPAAVFDSQGLVRGRVLRTVCTLNVARLFHVNIHNYGLSPQQVRSVLAAIRADLAYAAQHPLDAHVIPGSD